MERPSAGTRFIVQEESASSTFLVVVVGGGHRKRGEVSIKRKEKKTWKKKYAMHVESGGETAR
jgi:hypothetical protein